MRVQWAVAIALAVCAWPVSSVGARLSRALQLEPRLPVPDLPDPTYSGYVAVDRYDAYVALSVNRHSKLATVSN